tara:strand:- start:10104 stop:10997 length:894 start_codon:yes stop_codon:yes gene_type:complete
MAEFSLTTARDAVKQASLMSANSSVWTNTRIDLAIQSVMDWANTRYKILTATSTASTISKATTAASWSGGTATLTIGASHGILGGDMINVDGMVPNGWNGQYTVTGYDWSAGTIGYDLTTDPGTKTTDGTVSLINLPMPDLSGDSVQNVFTRRRFIRARTGMKKPLELVNFDLMMEHHVADSGQGEPLRIAFDTSKSTRPFLHPAPDAAYTYTITYLNAPTQWTAGVADATTVGSFNIEDDILRPMLQWGAPALLQHNVVDQKSVGSDPAWSLMVEHLDTILGDTRDLGIDRMTLDD